MGKRVALNQINVSDEITLLTDATGVPTTGVVAATAGHVIWYQRDENRAVVTDAGSAADLAAITTAHTDWNFLHAQAGSYRVDLPDAAFLEGAGVVYWGMYATGISGITKTITIEPLFKFQGLASSVTATTTTFPAGTNPYAGDEIVAVSGTGIKQTRLILSVSGQVATHLAWTVNISATTTTILLVAGDSHKVNLDAAVSTRSTVSTSDVGTQVDLSLGTYDAPTRAEATSDANSILARLPSALVGGKMDSEIASINAKAVIGAGIAADKWRA